MSSEWAGLWAKCSIDTERANLNRARWQQTTQVEWEQPRRTVSGTRGPGNKTQGPCLSGARRDGAARRWQSGPGTARALRRGEVDFSGPKDSGENRRMTGQAQIGLATTRAARNINRSGPRRPGAAGAVRPSCLFSYASVDKVLQRADWSAGRKLSQTRRLRLSDRPVAIIQVSGNGRAAVEIPTGPENSSKSGFSWGPWKSSKWAQHWCSFFATHPPTSGEKDSVFQRSLQLLCKGGRAVALPAWLTVVRHDGNVSQSGITSPEWGAAGWSSTRGSRQGKVRFGFQAHKRVQTREAGFTFGVHGRYARGT